MHDVDRIWVVKKIWERRESGVLMPMELQVLLGAADLYSRRMNQSYVPALSLHPSGTDSCPEIQTICNPVGGLSIPWL